MDLSKYTWIDYLSIAIVLVMFGLAAYFFPSLPEEIPMHFNFKGEVDGYASKAMIWSLPIIALALLGLMNMISKSKAMTNPDFQRRWTSGMKGKSDKFIIETTAYNDKQLGVMNFIIAFILFDGFVQILSLALTGKKLGSSWSTWILIFILFIPIFKMVKFSLRKDE